MISRLHPSFRRAFERLPSEVQRRARAAYRRFAADPAHPGLQFKRLHASLDLWSVRVTESYRAVGVRTTVESEDRIVWFFIGTHAEYDKLLATL